MTTGKIAAYRSLGFKHYHSFDSLPDCMSVFWTMAAPGPKYTHAIPSLLQAIPTLPALGDLDVNHPIAANTLLDPANLTNAKVVAQKLKSTFGKLSTKVISSEILIDLV